jgi:hypothetical protein
MWGTDIERVGVNMTGYKIKVSQVVGAVSQASIWYVASTRT